MGRAICASPTCQHHPAFTVETVGSIVAGKTASPTLGAHSCHGVIADGAFMAISGAVADEAPRVTKGA